MAEDFDGMEELLEADDAILAIERERRYRELKAARRDFDDKESGERFGRLEEVQSESVLLSLSVSTKRLVVHFAQGHFQRCCKMSECLRLLAERHLTTRFVEIDATRAPFLVAKWAVKVLPCVVRIDGGVGTDKVVGFEGVAFESDPDKLNISALERRLVLDP